MAPEKDYTKLMEDVPKLVTIKEQIVGLKASDVRELCGEVNPNHPLSKVKLRSVDGLPDNMVTYHEAVDIRAIQSNSDCEACCENGVRTKKLITGSTKRTVTKPSPQTEPTK